MSWSEAWNLAEYGYRELSFQAIYGYRQGTLASPLAQDDLVPKARRRVRQSKVLVSGVFAFISLGLIFVLSPRFEAFLGGGMPRGLYVGAVVSSLLLLQLVLLWWMALQMVPTFLASGVGGTLESLPVDGRTLNRAALIVFLRLFDLPAATVIVVTPLTIGVALGSVLSGLTLIPAVFGVVLVALALALKTAQFFVRRVQGGAAGPRNTVARWAFLVAWSVPAFSIYGFIALSGEFLSFLSNLSAQGALPALYLVFAVFPMSFAMIPAYADGLPTTGINANDAFGPVVVLAWTAIYLVLFTQAGAWLATAPRRLWLASSPVSVGRTRSMRAFVARSRPMAILVKDLRIASRTPPFALLVILPLLDAISVGVFTFVSSPATTDIFRIGVDAVATAALLATFFGPAFFAIEVIGYAYSRSLPLPSRSLILGKVLLVTFVYLAAAGVVLGLTAARLFSPLIFVAFIAAELPAIVAAAFVEFGLLVRKAESTGSPIVNLYSSAWTAMIVGIPGVIVAGAPILVYEILLGVASSLALPLMAAAAGIELGLAALGTYRLDRKVGHS
jgi:predicted permease